MTIFYLFEDSDSSREAKFLSLFILATIVASIVCLVAETSPELMPKVGEDHEGGGGRARAIVNTTRRVFIFQYSASVSVLFVDDEQRGHNDTTSSSTPVVVPPVLLLLQQQQHRWDYTPRGLNVPERIL